MKYKKEDFEKFIFEDKLPYTEIGKLYGISDTSVKKIASSLGISLVIRRKVSDDFIPHNKGKYKKHFCLNCGIETDIYATKYCSNKCQGELKAKLNYQDFLENNDNFCRASYSPKVFKKYFLEEQNHECAICKIKDEWNDKSIVFVLDHIDGNAANNKRENLRLVCPNCDSQLDTYKSKNKNSARKERYLKNYKKQIL